MQIAVPGPQNVLRSLRQQRSQIWIAILADVHLRLAFINSGGHGTGYLMPYEVCESWAPAVIQCFALSQLPKRRRCLPANDRVERQSPASHAAHSARRLKPLSS
jgi:hypothetical protein